MSHIVYIDVSAKIEQWAKDSVVVAASGEDARSLLVRSPVKQRAKILLASYGDEKYRFLATLVYMVVEPDLPNIEAIVIDRDYTGHTAESKIKDHLLNLLREQRPELRASFVRFENVAGHQADVTAREVFRGNQAPSVVVTWDEVRRVLVRKESDRGRLRSQRHTRVGRRKRR